MSSGLECNFINLPDGRSFYVLQSWSCPADCWDWREHDPIVGGPFMGFDDAEKHLRDNHQNPGGYSVEDLPLEQVLRDKVLADLLGKASGSPLTMPAFETPPVDVSFGILSPVKCSGTDGDVWLVTGDGYGSPIRIDVLEGWSESAETLCVAEMTAHRRETGIEVIVAIVSGDADRFGGAATSRLIGSARSLYPGEDVTVHVVDVAMIEEPDHGPEI